VPKAIPDLKQVFFEGSFVNNAEDWLYEEGSVTDTNPSLFVLIEAWEGHGDCSGKHHCSAWLKKVRTVFGSDIVTEDLWCFFEENYPQCGC
jgi:hypothetical protein